MSNPKASPVLVKLIVSTMWVSQGSIRDPGDCTLLRPSKNSTTIMSKVDKIPIIDVYAKSDKGISAVGTILSIQLAMGSEIGISTLTWQERVAYKLPLNASGK